MTSHARIGSRKPSFPSKAASCASAGTETFSAAEKLDRLHREPVSFQVDRFAWFRRIGWSVLVQGAAVDVPPGVRSAADLEPWAPGEHETLIRIVPTLITGRRIELSTGPLDCRGYL